MPRQFYEVDVQTTVSSGAHGVEAMAERADVLGFDGLVIADYVDSVDEVTAIKEQIDSASADIELRIGAKLNADSAGELKDLLREVRDRVEVVVVHGGTVEVNKTACGDTRVDVLAHPALRRKDAGLDHVAVKQAAANNVAIALTVRQLLDTYGKVRSHVLTHMRRNVRLAQKFDAPVVTSSGATSIDELRAPRDMAAIPRLLGMDVEHSQKTVSTVPKQILARADRVQDDSFVQPGVETVDDGDDDE